MGKGSLWRVEQQQRQNLIQALTRSPFFPNSAVDKINLKHGGGGGGSAGGGSIGINYDIIDAANSPTALTNGTSSGGGGGIGASGGMLGVTGGKSCMDARFDARLFPKLSKVFKDMEEHNALNDIGSGIGDIADDDIPSDYSTTNNNTNNSSNHNNNNSNNNKYHYHNNNNNMPAMQQQQQQNGIGANSITLDGNDVVDGVVVSSASNVTFNCYDSMERLARDCGADSIDDVNAATAMLALKHGPKVFAETFQNG